MTFFVALCGSLREKGYILVFFDCVSKRDSSGMSDTWRRRWHLFPPLPQGAAHVPTKKSFTEKLKFLSKNGGESFPSKFGACVCVGGGGREVRLPKLKPRRSMNVYVSLSICGCLIICIITVKLDQISPFVFLSKKLEIALVNWNTRPLGAASIVQNYPVFLTFLEENRKNCKI